GGAAVVGARGPGHRGASPARYRSGGLTMRITITARHCEIPDELRTRARTLVERLSRVATRPHDGQVLFSADHGTPTVEVRVHAGRGVVHVATAEGGDHRSALDPAERRASLETFFRFDLPCVVISKAQDPPPELLELARDQGIPVIRTKLKTAEFYRRLKPFLDDAFAPTTTVHASLADVFGVGLLFLGRSGIGKSECVLDLVERGHRLVADDVVHVTRHGNDVLIGRGHELARHYMEIRGVGLIDIRA